MLSGPYFRQPNIIINPSRTRIHAPLPNVIRPIPVLQVIEYYNKSHWNQIFLLIPAGLEYAPHYQMLSNVVHESVDKIIVLWLQAASNPKKADYTKLFAIASHWV
jgi:hypothetical protein